MGSKTNPGVIDCMAAAMDDEEVFVLLARDPLAPWLVAIWASVRVGNVAAALDNFRMMASEDLLSFYRANPDVAKSREAMSVVQQMMDWRQANIGKPGEQPRWKQSLVRPAPMMKLDPPLVESDVLTEHPPCEAMARRGIGTKASMADLEGHAPSCNARATGFFRDCSCGADISHANAPAIL